MVCFRTSHERKEIICVKTFCAPTKLEEQTVALIDKIFNVGRERIAKRRRSKSVSFGWMHYDSAKKNYVLWQCIFLNETLGEEILSKTKEIFCIIKEHYMGT